MTSTKATGTTTTKPLGDSTPVEVPIEVPGHSIPVEARRGVEVPDHSIAARPPAEPAANTTNRAYTGQPAENGATLRGAGFFPISSADVARARERGEPAAIAKLLHEIATDRSNLLIANDQTRVERLTELLGNLSANEIDEVRAHYISRYGCDPETNIRSWDFFQPLARLDDDVALELVALLNGPRLREHTTKIAAMLDRAPLIAADRDTYFSMLPTIGLWDAPRRGANLDSMERKILFRCWSETRPDIPIDDALRTIEAKLPAADLDVQAPRSRSIAVIVSSAGAQWQELMDWLTVMDAQNFHVQIFTPEGRPVAFQADSMCVNKRTAPVGHGCPRHLDPRGVAGDLARAVLARTAPAKDFDATKFGAVFAAGGLGFNEDVAVARETHDAKDEVSLEANPNIAGLMARALAEKLPQIAVCHGPTLYAATKLTIEGREESLCGGIETASLPPFERYVGLTGRKEPQFTLDVNTHGELEEAGAQTSVLKDIAKMSRVVTAQKGGIEILTGPGPQASRNLGNATVDVLARRWG